VSRPPCLVSILLCCLLFLAGGPSPAASAGGSFVFGTCAPLDSFPFTLQRRILTEAFRRNGWSLDIRYYEDRTLLTRLVETGALDGDALRSMAFARDPAHRGYVMIDAPTVSGECGAYAVRSLKVTDWASLAGLNPPVGYVVGETVVANPLGEHVPAERLRGYPAWVDGLRALMRGEIAVFAMVNDYYVRQQLRTPEFRDSGIHRLTVLARSEVRAYLSPARAAMAPALERTIRAMAQDGTIERFLLECMKKTDGS